MRTPAHTMAESARLKTGQCGSSRKSTTWPRPGTGCPEDPVDEVADGAAEDQPERDRPGQAAQPTGQPQDDDDDGRGHHRERDGQSLGDPEGRTGVPDQAQREQAAEQVDRLAVRELANREPLGHQVAGEHQAGHAQQQGQPGPPAGRLVALAQRRSSRCLHVMHSVARGNTCRRALPMGLPQFSQTP